MRRKRRLTASIARRSAICWRRPTTCCAAHDRGLAGERIHLGHVVLLASLYAKNDQTQTELAQTSRIEKSSIVLFLDTLANDGWVERRRHPTDRRAHHVHLTKCGRRRFTRIGKKLDQTQSLALADLSPKQRSNLASLLTRLIRSLERRGEAPDTQVPRREP